MVASFYSMVERRLFPVVRALLVLAFGLAGLAKVFGVSQMVEIFDAIGIGQWFRYLTGLIEVFGAFLLWIPITGIAFLGAVLLTVTMICAVLVHLLFIGGNPLPALLLGLLSCFAAWRLLPAPPPISGYR